MADEARDEAMNPEEEARRLAEREEVARVAIESVERANREAHSALRDWANALAQMARRGVDIGDTLLSARDRAERNP